MKFFIFLSVVTLVSAQCKYDDIKVCNTFENYIEDNGRFPNNAAAVKDFCNRLFEGGKCLRKKANECLKGSYKDLANEILDAEKNELTKLCQDGVPQFIIDVNNCFNKDDVLRGLKDIHTRYVDLVETAQGFEKSTYKNSICCSQLYSSRAVLKLNKETCGPEIAERLDQLLQNTLGSIFHKYCVAAQTYSECLNNLEAPIKSKFDEIIQASSPPAPKHKFAVPTLLEMVHVLQN